MVGIELLIGVGIGGFVCWLLTLAYNSRRKSKPEIPDWAKPMVGKLPPVPPSRQALLELFEDSVHMPEGRQHHVLKRVACPICNAPVSDFKEEMFGDERHADLLVECPHCGWSEFVER